MSTSGTESRAPQARERRGVWGYPPPGNFEKIGYPRLHFVRFENSLLGSKAGKRHNLVQNIPHESKNDGP